MCCCTRRMIVRERTRQPRAAARRHLIFWGFDIMETALTVVQVIVSLILIATVLLQSGKSAGLSGSLDGFADTFFGKNKARSLDAKLEKLTGICAVVFIILTFILAIL